jgi:hypothetical protein
VFFFLEQLARRGSRYRQRFVIATRALARSGGRPCSWPDDRLNRAPGKCRYILDSAEVGRSLAARSTQLDERRARQRSLHKINSDPCTGDKDTRWTISRCWRFGAHVSRDWRAAACCGSWLMRAAAQREPPPRREAPPPRHRPLPARSTTQAAALRLEERKKQKRKTPSDGPCQGDKHSGARRCSPLSSRLGEGAGLRRGDSAGLGRQEHASRGWGQLQS